MPKPRKPEGYDNALGSIFDFVFKQSQQKKAKVRPYRRSGEAYGSDQFANGLAELAANPLFYGSNAVLTNVNQIFLENAKFVEFRLDQLDARKYKYYDDSASRVRVRASDLGKALSDPNKFIDGILKGAKEEHKWMKITGAAAYLDSAVASYAGWRAGMSAGEAAKFGKAALAEYTTAMKEDDKKFIAGNAAMKREIEKARSDLASQSQWAGRQGSKEFATAVQKELERRAPEVLKREQMLYDSINHRTSTRDGHYAGKWEPPLDLRNALKAAEKEGDPAKIAALQQQVKDQYDDFDRRMNSRFTEIESDLTKRLGGDAAEAKRLVDELRKETKSQVGTDITAYRMNLHNNSKLRIMFTADPAEQARLSGAAYTALMWERLKGTDETTGAGVGASLNEIGKSIKDLQGKASLTPEESAYLKSLEAHQKKLIGFQGQMGDKHLAESWMKPNVGFEGNPVDNKIALGALKEQLGVERSKLLMELGAARRSGDGSAIALIQSQILGLDTTIGGLNKVRLGTFRHNVATGMMQYRALQGLMQGGLGAGLLNGTAYFSQASGIVAPGQMMGTTVNVMKDVNGVRTFEKRDGGYIVMGRTDINPNIANLSKLYYFTPGSIMKTFLYNGEGFNFLAQMRQQQIQRMFARDRGDLLKTFMLSKSGDAAFRTQFKGFFVETTPGVFDINSDAMATDYLELMTLLSARTDIPAPLKQVLGKAQKLYQSKVMFWSKIGNAYLKYGLAKKIQGVVDKVKGIRDNILTKLGLNDWRKRLLLKFSKSEAWKTAVGNFVGGSIGVKQLVKAGVVAIAQALGFATTGGLANLVIGQIASVVTDLAFKLAKPLLGVAFLAVWAACGILGFLMFGIISFLTPTTVAHNAIVPGDVIPGIELVPLPSDPPGNPDGNPSGGTPPTDAICPINIGASCSQGPNGRWSHGKMKTFAIDIPSPGVWKAPSDGTVTAVKPDKCPRSLGGAGQSVGNVVEFKDSKTGTIYRLIHADVMVTKGQRVTQGTPIATAATSLPISPCWTGPHLHLDTRNGSGWVDSEKWYNGLQCNLGRCG